MKRNESDAGHRIAVTQNGDADALAPAGRSLASRRRHSHRDRSLYGRDGNLDQRSSSARGGRPFRPRRAQCLNGSLQSDSLRGAPSAPKHEPASAQRTMAVLPFANLNAGPENDYLCDGLTEELIHSLTKVRELRVVAWNSAARMKGREQDLEAIREQLGVETILRGSIR